MEKHDNFSKVKKFPFTTLLIANISPNLSGRFGQTLSMCPFISLVSIVAIRNEERGSVRFDCFRKTQSISYSYRHRKVEGVESLLLAASFPYQHGPSTSCKM
jgi:hypothetical protein